MSLDVLHARVAFRERALLDVFDLALRFVVVHGRAFAKTALAATLPACLAALAIGVVAGPVWGWLAALVLGSFAQAPFTVLASRLVFEDEVRVRDAIAGAAADLLRLLGVRVLWLLLSCFVVTIPWVASAHLFVDEVLVLERAGVGQAFGRARRVVSGSFGEAFLAALLLALVQLVAIGLADVAGGIILGELLMFRAPRSIVENGWSVLAVIGWFASVPFVATARFFLYLDARTRTEGWDIQTRFAAIAARAEADAATTERAA